MDNIQDEHETLLGCFESVETITLGHSSQFMCQHFSKDNIFFALIEFLFMTTSPEIIIPSKKGYCC